VLEPDADNYRAVLSWALEQRNDVALGRRLAGALGYLWSAGLRVEGLRWAKTALESLGESPPDDVAARLWLIVAEVSDGMSSRDAAERAAVLFDRVANRHRLSSALYYLGFASYQVGKYEEAEASYRRALSIARETGDQPGVARSLNGLASALFVRGDVEGPRRCYAEALALHTAAKNEAGCAAVLGNLAELEFAEGNVEQALVHGLDALALDLKGTNEAIKAVGYVNVSAYRIYLGKLDEAKSDALESLRRARDAQGDMQIAIAMQNLALISALSHNPDRAAKLLGYVDRAYNESGTEREPTEAWTYRKLFASLLDQLPKDDVANLMAEGCAWSDDRAIDEAFAL
jgi:tetratricopeptide (TPR) repeat protein